MVVFIIWIVINYKIWSDERITTKPITDPLVLQRQFHSKFRSYLTNPCLALKAQDLALLNWRRNLYLI